MAYTNNCVTAVLSSPLTARVAVDESVVPESSPPVNVALDEPLMLSVTRVPGAMPRLRTTRLIGSLNCAGSSRSAAFGRLPEYDETG